MKNNSLSVPVVKCDCGQPSTFPNWKVEFAKTHCLCLQTKDKQVTDLTLNICLRAHANRLAGRATKLILHNVREPISTYLFAKLALPRN